MSKVIGNKYEFVMFFDVENGNPNGDPDAGNMPRIDPETSHGIVTDVCLKRKIRNYIELTKSDEKGYNIYVSEGSILNLKNKEAYIDADIDPKSKKKPTREEIDLLRKFMCQNYYDIRAFGAVMSTAVDCGVVRGPVQINFARSIDPIMPQEVTITRMAVTNENDMDKKTNEMGRKHIIPYALYRTEGYVSAKLAQKVSGFSEDDLSLLWEAIINMFEHDHSAARGKMTVRKLYVFKHSSALGNAPAHKLFDKIKCFKIEKEKPARFFSDYQINLEGELPSGVSCYEMVD